MAAIGPYSRPGRLAKLDGRTREARLLREVRSALFGHVGDKPSATQAALIERAAWLSLRIALMDEKMALSRMTDLDARTYLAWSNTLARTMALLGSKPVAPAPSIKDIISRRSAEKAVAA